jgi:hypothetical protein
MSELALTLLRFGFLLLLWAFVLFVVASLRRDLMAPDDAPLSGSAKAGVEPVAAAASPGRRGKTAKATARKLAVVEGGLAGTVVPLGNSPITVGRAADSTLVLSDDFASSHHARLYPVDGTWIVEDLGSTNGTWIGRTRLTSPTVLGLDQPLRIGRTVLELRK